MRPQESMNQAMFRSINYRLRDIRDQILKNKIDNQEQMMKNQVENLRIETLFTGINDS